MTRWQAEYGRGGGWYASRTGGYPLVYYKNENHISKHYAEIKCWVEDKKTEHIFKSIIMHC